MTKSLFHRGSRRVLVMLFACLTISSLMAFGLRATVGKSFKKSSSSSDKEGCASLNTPTESRFGRSAALSGGLPTNMNSAGSKSPSLPLGATINVNSTAQSPGATGDCTLGEAIQAANADAPVDGCTAGSSAGADTIM